MSGKKTYSFYSNSKGYASPTSGWSCVGVFVSKPEMITCENCGARRVRIVHRMRHPGMSGHRDVGVTCAGRMEGDMLAPRRREQQLAKTKGETITPPDALEEV